MDRCLPGFTPALIRLNFALDDDGYWSIAVLLVDDARYIRGDDAVVYGPLTWYEALDVASAVLDGCTPPQPAAGALEELDHRRLRRR